VDRSRHSGRVRIANRQFDDYELYVTADEAEHTMLATVDEHTDDDGVDKDDGLAAVAHYIMLHYAEKENLKKRKKKYKPKAGQYQLEAGIKHFGERGEIAVTKELEQFNTYGVFEPKSAADLTDDDKRKALASLIFLKKKSETVISRHAPVRRGVYSGSILRRKKLPHQLLLLNPFSSHQPSMPRKIGKLLRLTSPVPSYMLTMRTTYS
jgi:hypothetical protein